MPSKKPVAAPIADIQDKTKNNLTGEEERLLDQALYDLRLRFVEVSKTA